METIPEIPAPARYNVVAVFDGMPQARTTIEKLQRHGVDAVHIALVGAGGAHAEDRSGTRAAREEDVRASSYVGRRVLLGGAIGVVFGAVAGLAIGLALGFDGKIATGIIVGALAFGVIGALTAGVLSLPLTEDWALTFRDVGNDEVIVAVRSDSRGDYERARKILEGEAATTVARYVVRGGRLRAA
jgi:hypothetical protein